MDRRGFVVSGTARAAGLGGVVWTLGCREGGTADGAPGQDAPAGSTREQVPRASREVYLNAAAGTPLAAPAEEGMRRYLDFARLGPGEGRGDYVGEAVSGARTRFAELVGAAPEEIGYVHCTKAGEQLVLDGLDLLGRGGNVVTNDLHFTGSLHNLEGLRRTGVDVRVVPSEDLRVPLERMADVIDHDTRLVTVSLVSNINGHREPMRELADLAHDRGALVFADIIQAVGSVPLDLPSLGIDVAATSAYKWLFGIHGAGFLYVRRDLQGGALPDRLFPGHVRHNYAPWVDTPDPDVGAFAYDAPGSAARYQPGHVAYIGYCAAWEALGMLLSHGVEEAATRSQALLRRLADQLDPDRYRLLTPDLAASGIGTWEARDGSRVEEALRSAGVVVSLIGPDRRWIRVSPSIYNTEADVDRLAEALA